MRTIDYSKLFASRPVNKQTALVTSPPPETAEVTEPWTRERLLEKRRVLKEARDRFCIGIGLPQGKRGLSPLLELRRKGLMRVPDDTVDQLRQLSEEIEKVDQQCKLVRRQTVTDFLKVTNQQHFHVIDTEGRFLYNEKAFKCSKRDFGCVKDRGAGKRFSRETGMALDGSGERAIPGWLNEGDKPF